MKVAILLGGLFRGNDKTWQCIKKLSEYLNAKIYVSSDEKWENMPFKFSWVKTSVPQKEALGNIFSKESCYLHEDKEKYYHQWRHLNSCYNFLKNDLTNDDIVIKLRNDLIFDIFDVYNIPNSVVCPEKEFHSWWNFDKNWGCNDQILFMNKQVANIYFNLIYCKNLDSEKIINTCIGKLKLKQGGIESIIREYLRDNNIDIKTFKLNYYNYLLGPRHTKGDYNFNYH